MSGSLQARGRRAVRAVYTVGAKSLGRSDRARWSRGSSLDQAWDARTRLMLSSIAPGATVIDIGAGSQAARGMLPPGATYIPVDIVARTADTVVCDLNHGQLPDLEGTDVIASGVIEYVHDPGRLITWFAAVAGRCVVSYETVDRSSRTRFRRSHGWVNDLSERELVGLLESAGFVVDRRAEWGNQVILFATRPDAEPNP